MYLQLSKCGAQTQYMFWDLAQYNNGVLYADPEGLNNYASEAMTIIVCRCSQEPLMLAILSPT